MNFFKSKRISLSAVGLAGLAGILTLMSSLSCAGNAEDGGDSSLQWIPWSQDVVAQAQKADKLILIDVYADWCGPCKMMDRITYKDPAVLKKLEGFITVKVDSDTDRKAAARFGTGSIPTTVILTSDGDPILTESGYYPPERFLGLLDGVTEVIAALQRLEKEVEAAPEDPIKAAELGELYMEMKRTADAARWLERALARESDLDRASRSSAMFNLGLAHLTNESFEKGIAQLTVFRQEFPNNTQATRAAELVEIGKFYLAGVKARKGDYEGARKLYRYLIEQSKNKQLVAAAQKELSAIERRESSKE